MSATTPSIVTAEPRRIVFRVPRPLWIGLATVVLVVAGLGLRFYMPIYRQQVAIREIKRVGGQTEMGPGWPELAASPGAW